MASDDERNERANAFLHRVTAGIAGFGPPLTPSADVPACRDEDPAHPAALAACYPDPPDYQHPADADE